MEQIEEDILKAICKHCGRTIVKYEEDSLWVHYSNYIAPCKPWLAVYAEPKEDD